MRSLHSIVRPNSWLALAALLACASGCDALPGKPRPEDRPVLPAQVTDFDPLYAQNCSGCHGADGRFGAARPLNDPLYLALVNADVVRKVIAEGVPGTAQPALAQHAGGTLTEAQIDILARGLFSRWAQPDRFRGLALPSYHSDEAGDPERGAAAYQDYCANCHGPEGSGGPNGGSVVDPSYLALTSDQALRTAVIAGRIDLGMPDYRHLVAGRPMTGREITDVVAWLARHRVRLLVSDPGGGER